MYSSYDDYIEAQEFDAEAWREGYEIEMESRRDAEWEEDYD